jgi:TusA-related sulfurtransferase
MTDRTTRGGTEGPLQLDLLGVRCPVNWARAKTELERMPRGRRLELVTDDPRALVDIPVAAEAEGHVVLEAAAEGKIVRIVIEC